jgi:hypothetical protein
VDREVEDYREQRNDDSAATGSGESENDPDETENDDQG